MKINTLKLFLLSITIYIFSYLLQWIFFGYLGIQENTPQYLLYEQVLRLYSGDISSILNIASTVLITSALLLVLILLNNKYAKFRSATLAFGAIGILLYVPLFLPCEGFGCITYTIFPYIAAVYTLFYLSIAPIAWVLNKPAKKYNNATLPIFRSYIFFLAVTLLLWFVGTVPYRTLVFQQDNYMKPYIEKALKNITYMEPSYLPYNYQRKTTHSYLKDFETRDLTIDGVYDLYACRSKGSVKIIQGSILEQKVKTIESLISELTKDSYVASPSDIERVTINTYKGVYIPFYNDSSELYKGKLYYFTTDSLITIELPSECFNKEYNIKDEVVKIAISMKPISQK